MNPFFWPTLAASVILFWAGYRMVRAARAPSHIALLWMTALVLALPGGFFTCYYTGWLGEPLWLYRFRTISGSEISAAGLGLLAGVLEGTRESWPRFKRLTSRLGIPVLFAIILFVPYVKPLSRPLQLPGSPRGWVNGVCLQSTSSTCGPASAATLTRLAGKTIEEFDLARECFTSGKGTENWYLARALKRHGMQVAFRKTATNTDLLFPAIAGVKLTYGTGHFIPILGKEGDNYIIGDPMIGSEVKSLAELRDAYQFTGFFLIVK
jgi:hypothetical protein